MTGRILAFCRSTPHHVVGGMETQAWSLAAQWVRLGVSVTLVTTAIPGTEGSFTEDGLRVVPLAETRPGRYSRSWWRESCRFWQGLQSGPDVVFSVSAGAYAVARMRSRHPGSRFVLQAHGTSVMELQAKLASGSPRSLATTPRNLRAMVTDMARYRDFDQIIVVGERVRDSLTGRLLRRSIDPARVRLVYNGVALAEAGFDAGKRALIRARLGIPDGVTAVACVGRMHHLKRWDRALQAAAVLRGKGFGDGFRFVLIGDGPHLGRLRAVARELEVEGMVSFVGRVERSAVAGFNSACDISLSTTAWAEGLSMAVLEALACGLPCVVTAGAVTAPALQPLLHQVDPADVEMVAVTLLRAASPGGRESLLPNDFLLEQSARNYLAAFADLARP